MEHSGKFIADSIVSDKHREDIWLSPERMPFLSLDSLFFAGYGISEYKSGFAYSLLQSYWSFQQVISGQFCAEVGKKHVAFKTGDLFITRPGISYKWQVPVGGKIKKRYMMLNNGRLISLLCEQGPLAERDHIVSKDPARFRALWEQMEQLCGNGGDDVQHRLSVLAYDFLLRLADECRGKKSTDGFDRVIREIRNSIGAPLSVSELAEKYGIGQRTLTRMFQKHLHCTPSQFIIRERMRYAEQLLQSGGISIESTATLCGYRNFSFFSREFRRYHNETPREYRKRTVLQE